MRPCWWWPAAGCFQWVSQSKTRGDVKGCRGGAVRGERWARGHDNGVCLFVCSVHCSQPRSIPSDKSYPFPRAPPPLSHSHPSPDQTRLIPPCLHINCEQLTLKDNVVTFFNHAMFVCFNSSRWSRLWTHCYLHAINRNVRII